MERGRALQGWCLGWLEAGLQEGLEVVLGDFGVEEDQLVCVVVVLKGMAGEEPIH